MSSSVSFSTEALGLAHIVFERLTRRKAEDQESQGGLLTGKDPSAVNTADPFRLWVIQIGIIILTTQLLSLVLGRLRQPKVISEVLAGIVLGPTAFGRIPGFTQHVFPAESRVNLSLTATIGLVLFLFLVGLEIDIRVIKRNARNALFVSTGGMLIPFGLGAAIAVPLYAKFIDHDVASFGHFLLFVGVAFSITAFPVLCRILTELKLLDTTVGVVVLSAGVGNDIVGWVLLALTVALVNASSGLTALWVLLCSVAWTLFLLFIVKRCMLWLARKTGSVNTGPTPVFMTVTILVVFGSAFFTDIIGVHAIFGGFLAGLVVPHEGGLAISLTEKLEDMVSIIFLPLYFTLSGLSTNLGLLNDGVTWAYTILICVGAYIGKFGGGTLAARAAGFNWRESTTIGSLMSCKGLVELIVLNVGLAAGILNTRIFSMFVLEALLLTMATTPMTLWLYPMKYRARVTVTGQAFSNVEGEAADKQQITSQSSHKTFMGRFTVVLDKMENLPALMTLTQLLRAPYSHRGRASDDQRASTSSHTSYYEREESTVVIDALRLIELTDRTSALMRSSITEELIDTDPLINVFRTFGEINDIPVTASLSVLTHDAFSNGVAEHATARASDLIIVSWAPAFKSHEAQANLMVSATSTNPFDAFFKSSGENSTSYVHSHFLRKVFSDAEADVALYVDRGRNTAPSGGMGYQHIILPFFGGPDDRLALRFAIQLCANDNVTATIIRITKTDPSMAGGPDMPAPVHTTEDGGEAAALAAALRENNLTVQSVGAFPDTIYPHASTQHMMESETADNIAWNEYSSPPADVSPSLRPALARARFTHLTSPIPLHAVVELVATEEQRQTKRRRRLLVLTGRGRRMAVESHHSELKQMISEHGSHPYFGSSDSRKTVGDVATALIISENSAGVLVVQATDA